jgi:hypothetical protein
VMQTGAFVIQLYMEIAQYVLNMSMLGNFSRTFLNTCFLFALVILQI